MYWALFQAFLENKLPGNAVANDEEVIQMHVRELTGAFHVARPVSSSNGRPRADPRPRLTASVREEMRLKNRLRTQWQITECPVLKSQVKCLQRSVTYRLNDWRNEKCSDALKSMNIKNQLP
jgi:hypothetical protein